MTFSQLPDAVKTLAVLTTETNKSIVKRATLQHVTGKVFVITLSNSDVTKPAFEVEATGNVRLVCSNALTLKGER